MTQYIHETVIILKPSLDALTLQNEIRALKSRAQKFSNAKAIKCDIIGEKQLAYEIQGNKSGYFILMRYMASQSEVAEFERYLKICENVIKFITIRAEYTENTLDDLDPNDDSFKDVEQPVDAMDVLLGLAKYNNKNKNKKNKKIGGK